jgi:RNA polymerase sigma-70 factor (ECF subfamily)
VNVTSGAPAGCRKRGIAETERREEAYRPGSVADFERLYRATYGRLFGTVLVMVGDRAAAEDCLHEAYLKAFRSWPRWRPKAPAEAWLHRIAVNQALSYRRWARLREAGELVRRLGRPPETDPQATVTVSSDFLDALRRIPPKQQAAIVLRYYHGYTNREIGIALGTPERTVASRLAAARDRLRKELGPGFEPGSGTSPSRGVPIDEEAADA